MARLQNVPSRLGKLPAKRQQAQGNPDSWRGNKTSAQRGYGYKWQQARAGYLRLHPFCVMCLRDSRITDADIDRAALSAGEASLLAHAAEMRLPSTRHAAVALAFMDADLPVPLATVVDHKIPHGGDQVLFWRRDLWQSLCKRHHDSDKQRIERGSQRQAIGPDGWPVED